MKTSIIKDEIAKNIGRRVKIRYNTGRNKIEEYDVIIKDIYPNIFVVFDKNLLLVKSFSYFDLINKAISIIY